MQFIKKVLVLKQTERGFSLSERPITGIARIEIDNGVADLYLSLINFANASDGSFFALVIDCKKNVYSFPLGKRPSSFTSYLTPLPDVKNGFCVGICFIKNHLPLTVAFAKSDEFSFSISDFKKTVADKCIENRRMEKKKNEQTPPDENQPDINFPDPTPVKPPYPPAPMPDPNKNPPDEFILNEQVKQKYNDEAVATENYFDYDKTINDKLQAIRRCDNERIRLEDELPFIRYEKEEEKGKQDDNGNENETGFIKFQIDKDDEREDQPYYLSVREELNSIFSSYPPEEELEKAFPDSKFSKVWYSDEKYYVVGLVKEGGKEKYICYGVPAVYSKEPPKELKGFCSFIPLSVFDMKGDGYWMMFQDVVTGECIKK